MDRVKVPSFERGEWGQLGGKEVELTWTAKTGMSHRASSCGPYRCPHRPGMQTVLALCASR